MTINFSHPRIKIQFVITFVALISSPIYFFFAYKLSISVLFFLFSTFLINSIFIQKMYDFYTLDEPFFALSQSSLTSFFLLLLCFVPQSEVNQNLSGLQALLPYSCVAVFASLISPSFSYFLKKKFKNKI